MEKLKAVLKDLSSIIGALAVIGGVIWGGFELTKLMHSSPDHVQEAEEFFEDYDEVKAYGEYIIDSIEEVHTQEWRKSQEIKDSLTKINIDSLKSFIKLNIRISDEAKKAANRNNPLE